MIGHCLVFNNKSLHVMNATAQAPWMENWRRRVAAILPFAIGVLVGFGTVWILTFGGHYMLDFLSAGWWWLLAFGCVLGLIFVTTMRQPLLRWPRLVIGAFLSGAVIILCAWALGFAIRARYPDFDSSVASHWLSALSLAYWLGAPWLLARLTARVLRPALSRPSESKP
jgi:hypothetical protein